MILGSKSPWYSQLKQEESKSASIGFTKSKEHYLTADVYIEE
jgi:hypothetical protein